MDLDVFLYTALANERGSKGLIASYGMEPLDTPDGVAGQLSEIVLQRGEEGLDQLAQIHPDLDLFQDRINAIKSKYTKEKEDFFQRHFFNANGTNEVKTEVASIKNTLSDKNTKDLLIVGGLIVVALAIVMKK